MIFCGTMRDMKRRLRRADFAVELEGPPEEIGQLLEQVAGLEGIEAQLRAAHTMVVRVGDGRRQAGALAEVLRLVDASRLSLQSIHSGLNETENAYLQLLQEDEAHGFQRFDLDARHANDAAAGNPPL
jgi:hypothetical protein